ncbi:MAG TPA: dienelactone hydrolase family protein [Thermoanaerobaculia bacterium]|nr:dienelactone hydrolase family protein [Thermoanaerobaculia bacterium]
MTTDHPAGLPLRCVRSTPSGRPDTDALPLVIVMHGRGADANDLADLAPLLDSGNGLRFLFPNAPKPWDAGGGMTFGFTWFDGWPPTPESFAESRRMVLDFLKAAVAHYPTPPGQVVLTGFSQGALLALNVALHTEVELAGVVAMSGAFHEIDLDRLAKRQNLPILIVHGIHDEVIPLLAAHRARRVLESHGLSPEYHEFPMGHQVTQESMAVVAEFIERCLQKTGNR